VALVIPGDFSRRLRQGLDAEVQSLLDGSFANTAIVALNYVDAVTAGFTARVQEAALATRGIRLQPAVRVDARVRYNFGLSALFLLSSLGLGLLIGVIGENLQQALLLSFFTIIPVMVISGVLMPVESMPTPIQYLSLLSPLRHYMEIGLGIFLKGVGLDVLWRPAASMTAIGLAVLGFGLVRFRRQLA